MEKGGWGGRGAKGGNGKGAGKGAGKTCVSLKAHVVQGTLFLSGIGCEVHEDHFRKFKK